MTGLKILAGVLFVLFLLAMIRAGGSIEYSAAGVEIQLRVGVIRIHIYPRKEKEDRKKGKKKTAKEESDRPKAGGSLKQLKRYLPLIGQAAGELKRKIRIDSLDLDLIAGGSDAAGTAMLFGYSNMAIGMLWPIFEQNFHVKEHRFRMAADFSAETTTVYAYVTFSARIGQLLCFSVRYGWKFIKLYLKERKNVKSKKEAI